MTLHELLDEEGDDGHQDNWHQHLGDPAPARRASCGRVILVKICFILVKRFSIWSNAAYWSKTVISGQPSI
jgi:hypothetical protein